mmetsp:Transcript_32853/g.106103  ORF Transcript_32853/g.106103 Transcript_32853/m.106103 type:complete len:201 (-) Transcript_32853:76-678(-)
MASLVQHRGADKVELGADGEQRQRGERHPALLRLDHVERQHPPRHDRRLLQRVLLLDHPHVGQRVGEVGDGRLARIAVDVKHLRGPHPVPRLADRLDYKLVLVSVARIQKVEREVVAAANDAKLVRLPVVVGDDQAVSVAHPLVVNGECDVERLIHGVAVRLAQLLVEEERRTRLLGVVRRSREQQHREHGVCQTHPVVT